MIFLSTYFGHAQPSTSQIQKEQKGQSNLDLRKQIKLEDKSYHLLSKILVFHLHLRLQYVC